MAYPMWVAPVREVLEMSKLVPHQKLIEARAIAEVVAGMAVIFVSHQWLGFDRPDGDMKQFRVLQRVLRDLIDGSVAVKMCPSTAMAFSQAESYLTPDEGRKLVDAHVWYDFFWKQQGCKDGTGDEAYTLLQLFMNTLLGVTGSAASAAEANLVGITPHHASSLDL